MAASPTSTVRAPIAGGLAVLPLVAAAGALAGLAEWAYHVLGPRVPAGEPGAAGPVLAAYLALGLTEIALPALVAAVLTASAWRWLSVSTTWLAGLLPTALVAVAHVAHERQLEWFRPQQLHEHHTRVVLVGGSLALAGTVLGVVVSLRLLRGPVGRSRALGGVLAAAGIAAALGGPVWLATLLRLPAVPAAAAPSGAPNVLLLTIDTLRRDAVGAYGGGATPALDALISSGVRADGVSPSSWTRPAMGALFSAAAPTGVGADAQRAVNPDSDWWPERLRAAGWITCAIVTNPHLRPSYGFRRGFDAFDHSDQFERAEPIAQAVWVRWLTRQLTERLEYDRADQVVARAARWLGHAPAGPWLLWVHLLDPHLPYILRGPHGEAADPDPGAWLEPLRPALERGAFRALMPTREGKVATTAAARAAVRELYRREVLFTDRHVPQLIERARAASAQRGLLWVVASDHGEEFWEDGGFEHGHALNDAVLDVPLAIGGPGLPPGARIGGMKLQDIGPSLLALLGLPPMEPQRGTRADLAQLPATLTAMAFGSDRSALLRSAGSGAAPDSAAVPAPCGVAPLLAEGILYGPAQTRLVFGDGMSITRADSTGWLRIGDVCSPEAPVVETTLAALEQPVVHPPLVVPPPDPQTLRAGLLRAVDRWRLLAHELGAPVKVDPAALERLRALGYIR